jgi:hypothetical protein
MNRCRSDFHFDATRAGDRPVAACSGGMLVTRKREEYASPLNINQGRRPPLAGFHGKFVTELERPCVAFSPLCLLSCFF